MRKKSTKDHNFDLNMQDGLDFYGLSLGRRRIYND